MTRRPRRGCAALALGALAAGGGLGVGAAAVAGPPPTPIVVGAAYPLRGALGAGGADEGLGIRIARDLVDADGGVGGRTVEIAAVDVSSVDDVAPAMARLDAAGVRVVLGSYASDLSILAGQAASARGMVYWEAGAVADRLTAAGSPLVFRVGASGSMLGSNALRFAADQLAPRLGRPATAIGVGIVAADDAYATSVADAAAAEATAAGMRVVSRSTYQLAETAFTGPLSALRATRPDIVVLASHIPDGIAFRRAYIAAGLHADAFIGSTMAQCLPDFGDALGGDAVGVFASDRPGDGFDAGTLPAAARAVFDRFAAAWQDARGGIAPSEAGIAAFSATWALLHDVLPRAAGSGPVDAQAVAAAARGVDLPGGSLPDGGGLRFSDDPATRGQNLRAAAVIWQWQAPRHSVVVWPPTYATGSIGLVPLPR